MQCIDVFYTGDFIVMCHIACSKLEFYFGNFIIFSINSRIDNSDTFGLSSGISINAIGESGGPPINGLFVPVGGAGPIVDKKQIKICCSSFEIKIHNFPKK